LQQLVARDDVAAGELGVTNAIVRRRTQTANDPLTSVAAQMQDQVADAV